MDLVKAGLLTAGSGIGSSISCTPLPMYWSLAVWGKTARPPESKEQAQLGVTQLGRGRYGGHSSLEASGVQVRRVAG